MSYTGRIKAVVLDVGETLTSDTSYWGSWADWLGVSRHTLSALVGVTTALGMSTTEAFRMIDPEFDLAAERAKREASPGHEERVEESDLYPDVRPALAQLRENGLTVGVAGNQTAKVGEMLRALDLPIDWLATSGEWGVSKPQREFFDMVVERVDCPPEQIAYVGDHRDFDIIPARAAGLCAVHIRRGPWGHLYAADPDVNGAATWCIRSLAELVQITA